jgi:two-component system sensor histidine kinase KdpD
VREARGARHHGSATPGQLRVYLGFAPGAGTTCALLSEGHRRAEQGVDVVVAAVQTHGRAGTAGLLEGLEIIPPVMPASQDGVAGEMDLGAVLARQPQVALVDEPAHNNLPGAGHATRWQDAGELLAAGIDVISTVSIGQLDSLADVVEKITGVAAQRTVPDPVVRAAGEIELVDLAAEMLRDRMASGQIYPPGQARGGAGRLVSLRAPVGAARARFALAGRHADPGLPPTPSRRPWPRRLAGGASEQGSTGFERRR